MAKPTAGIDYPRNRHELLAWFPDEPACPRYMERLRWSGFIVSTGLRLIIATNARSRTDGNRFRLRAGPPQVQRIFELTATTDLLPFTDR